MNLEAIVYVVDEDQATCELIGHLAAMMNLRCEVCASGQAFLESYDRQQCGCVLTELKGPGVNGFHIQQQLAAEGATLPVIFLAAQATLSIAVRAMRAGAFHFLEKPLHEQELWDAIQGAVAMDRENREAVRRETALQERLGTLTLKEEQVLRLIAEGKASREIAKELELSIRTIEVRRNVLMKKLAVNTPEELLRFAVTACSSYSWLAPRKSSPFGPAGPRGGTGGNGNGNGNGKPSIPRAVARSEW